jgi:hypothetical protein
MLRSITRDRVSISSEKPSRPISREYRAASGSQALTSTTLKYAPVAVYPA